jgi:hypothetical protein
VDIDELAALIGPPPSPPPSVDWEAVQQALGLALPAAFMAFATRYGPIELGNFVWVWSPAGGHVPFEAETHQWLRGSRDFSPGDYPYAIWPEPGGLLMWGHSRGEHHFFWDPSASGDPRRWPTVVLSSGKAWRRLDRPMTDVLAALVQGGPEHGLDIPALPGRCGPDLRGALPSPARRTVFASPTAADRILAGVDALAAPLDWSGSLVPSDYRALLDRIGPGTLSGRLMLLAPGGPPGYDLVANQFRLADTMQIPAAVHPQPGGLRLWGRFTTGETAWWLPAWYDPDGWPLVLCAPDGVGWQRLDLSTTEFIAAWAAGEMDLPVLVPYAQPDGRTWRSATEPVPPAPAPTYRTRDPLRLLATLLGAPKHRPADYSSDERRLGTRLPSDFTRLYAAYGELDVCGISIPPPGRLADYHKQIAAFALTDLPAYPLPRGLLYCGGTEDRTSLWWDTSAPDPDSWSMVVESAGTYHPFSGTLTDLLVHALTGRAPQVARPTPSTPPRRPA